MTVAERVVQPTVLELSDDRWKAFVGSNPDATVFHRPEWARLVADCYGFRAFAVATTDPSGSIRAGLPVVEVRRPLRGSHWVSLPFTDHCPPLVPSQDDATDLREALRTAARDAGARRAEVRGSLPGAEPTGWPTLRHVLDLGPDPAEVYERFHPSQVRRNIRRAERERLTVRRASRAEDLLGTFYALHLRTRRRQGVPIQPRRFFELLWERIVEPGLGWELVVESDSGPIAAALFMAWNGTVIYKFGASDESAWSLRPNHLLFWEAIRTACQDGYRTFDFGRTDADHEGLRAFKRSWGAREEPLAYTSVGGRTGRPAPAGPPDGIAARALAMMIRRGPAPLCRVAGELLYRFAA